MIITCPHCETRYQVAFEAIGSAGRKVQCATCNQAWQQVAPAPEDAEKDDLVAVTEDGLDEAFASEALSVADAVAKKLAETRQARAPAGAGSGDTDELRQRQRAFSQRQNSLVAQLPMARLRRAARLVSAVILIGMLGFGYFGRIKIVETFPSMAGVYEAMGLGVNVVGLDFADIKTLRTLVDGKEVLIVTANIIGMQAERVNVPQVVITLIGAKGEALYVWSVRPEARSMTAGQSASLRTQLTLPPGNVARVKLAFAGGGSTPGAAQVRPGAPPSQLPRAEP